MCALHPNSMRTPAADERIVLFFLEAMGLLKFTLELHNQLSRSSAEWWTFDLFGHLVVCICMCVDLPS